MMHEYTHHPHAPRGQAGRQLYGKLLPACFQQLDAAQLQHAVGIDASCNSHNKISCHKQQSWGYCRTQPIATPELPPPVTILSAKANGMWIMKSLTRLLRTPLSWLRTRGTHARAHTHTHDHTCPSFPTRAIGEKGSGSFCRSCAQCCISTSSYAPRGWVGSLLPAAGCYQY